MLKIDESTRRVSMLRVGRSANRDSCGVTVTRLVAASAAAAMAYGRFTACMAPPFPG